MIPMPEFIVLYNGKDDIPDFGEMRLSDSFIFEDEKDCFLELVAKIYNINKGRNAEMASKSPVLSGYGEFISEIRENLKTMNLKESIRAAIKSCISKNILVSFLERNGSEVENMLLTEWNMKDALAVAKEEGVEEGMEKGIIQTARAMLAEGMSLDLIVKITGLRKDEIEGIK
jgi:predicted transposase/invertase (TIGR01784 family)